VFCDIALTDFGVGLSISLCRLFANCTQISCWLLLVHVVTSVLLLFIFVHILIL